MDAVSYAHSAKQAQRIKKFNENPDSTSGILTQPSVIQTGETVNIPAGRTAIMANTVIDGTITLDGTMFIPSGATFDGLVEKVTSTDNAIARYDGITGAVQNSGVVIDDSGNIGIGVTPNINTTLPTIFCNYLMAAGMLESYTLANASYQSGVYKYLTTGIAASFYGQANGVHSWHIAPSGTAGGEISWTQAMSLDASGVLKTLNTIEAGTTSSGVYSGQAYITAYGGAANNYTYIQGRSTTSDTNMVYASVIGGISKSAIYANGSFGSATSVYGGVSDAKLKENVVDTTPKLNKLMQVQVRNFNFIGQEDKQIGVIAQEIEQIFPSVVFETKDTKQVEVTKERVIPAVDEVKDEEGNVITEAKPESIEEYIEIETQETGEVTKNVKYSIIYMMAIKALQELNAKVEAMQLEINELKGGLNG